MSLMEDGGRRDEEDEDGEEKEKEILTALEFCQ